MRRWLPLVLALLVVLPLLATLGCGATQADQFTEEDSGQTAEGYVRSSPTFAFDGIEDSLVLVNTEAARCPCCWAFDFEFECRHAGYGDRTGQVLAQVISPHTARIVVNEGQVVQAVMDGTWDMMTQEMVPASAETIDTEVGATFFLTLESNPSTGYAWTAHFDEEYLELVGSDFEPSSSLLGAGGVESFEFRALKQGTTQVMMFYERSWEQGCIDQATYSVRVAGADG